MSYDPAWWQLKCSLISAGRYALRKAALVIIVLMSIILITSPPPPGDGRVVFLGCALSGVTWLFVSDLVDPGLMNWIERFVPHRRFVLWVGYNCEFLNFAACMVSVLFVAGRLDMFDGPRWAVAALALYVIEAFNPYWGVFQPEWKPAPQGLYDPDFDLLGEAAADMPPKPVDPSWGRALIGYGIGVPGLLTLLTADVHEKNPAAMAFGLLGLLAMGYGLAETFDGIGNLFKAAPSANPDVVRQQKVFGDADFADSREAARWLSDKPVKKTTLCIDGLPKVGSSRPDAIELGILSERGGGHAHGWLEYRITYGGCKPSNIVLCGPNRCGKGSCVLIPNLLQMEGRSIVVIDPKGELAAVTAEYRRTLGEVVVIDPFNYLVKQGFPHLQSAGFNPLLRLDPDSDSFDSDVRGLAAALVTSDSQVEPHWDESAREVVAAFIMLEVLQARALRKTPSLYRVRQRLCERSEPEEWDEDDNVTAPASGLYRYVPEMRATLYPTLRDLTARFEAEKKELSSIMGTAQRHTSIISDAPMARDLQKPGFDFRRLRHEPVTVYVILPWEHMETYGRWLRLVVTAALQAVMSDNGKIPVLFMLDEFAALGRLDVILSSWAVVNGMGVQIMPVVQDFSQFARLYGKGAWKTFVNNAGIVAAFGGADGETAKWFSERGGERTVTAWSYNQGTGERPGGSTNTNEGMTLGQHKVKLFPPERFHKLPKGGLMMAGMRGSIALAKTEAYYDRPELAARARPNPYIHEENTGSTEGREN